MRVSRLISALLIPDSVGSISCADVVILRHDADCGYLFEGKKYSQLADTLALKLHENGLTTLTIATPYSAYDPGVCYNDPVSMNRITFLGNICARALRYLTFGRKTMQISRMLRQWAWRRVIAKSKPRLVVGIQPPLELFEVCMREGIPCYDLQHGVVLPEELYYAALVEILRFSDQQVGILCWDEATVRKIRAATEENPHVDTPLVGNLWVRRFLHPSSSDKLTQQAIGEAPLVTGKPVILITLQWRLQELYRLRNVQETLSGWVMPQSLENIIRSTCDEFDWWIKMHPVAIGSREGQQQLNYLTRTFGGLAGVHFGPEVLGTPLPALMKFAHAHLTDSSACTLEAQQFGLVTGLWNPIFEDTEVLKDWFPAVEGVGDIGFVNWQEDEILRWLKVVVKNARRAGTLFESESQNFASWASAFSRQTAVTGGAVEVLQ
jgi:hypothetical protein